MMLGRLLEAPVQIQTPNGLIEAAWCVADELGWAKTYDAQYVALAQMLACKLVSVDERLLRRVSLLNIAVRPRDLQQLPSGLDDVSVISFDADGNGTAGCNVA